MHRIDFVDVPFEDFLRHKAHLWYVANVAAFLLQSAVLHLLLLALINGTVFLSVYAGEYRI